MSLPATKNNFLDYLKDVIPFLKTYQWLFSIPNTHILSKKLLDKFPGDWKLSLNNLSITELNEIPFGYINEKWPNSLKQFLIQIESLKPCINYGIIKNDIKVSNTFFKGLNPKKIHEILALAPYINETCKLYKIDVIIDIGAGLGYLPQLLYEIYGYKILAVEADVKKIETAKKRQSELYNKSINHIKYIHHFVDENSSEFLQKCIDDNFENTKNVCLVGLHACADLSISLLKLFSNMICVTQAVVMPCCYHRLKKIPYPEGEYSEECFENFPVSCSLRSIYDDEEANKFLTGAFLRLACQNTAANWRSMSLEKHRTHWNDAMRRAILQLVADTEGYNLKRLKRKTRLTSESNDFESYLNNLKNTHSLINPKTPDQELIDTNEFKDKMLASWKLYENDCKLMEVYTAFQTSLQSICENIILLDRVEMVKEWGYLSFARKLTDDSISPRCYAIVARKQETIDS